jgi:hypothetical protein
MTKVCTAAREMKEKDRGCDGTFWELNHGMHDNPGCIGCKHLRVPESRTYYIDSENLGLVKQIQAILRFKSVEETIRHMMTCDKDSIGEVIFLPHDEYVARIKRENGILVCGDDSNLRGDDSLANIQRFSQAQSLRRLREKQENTERMGGGRRMIKTSEQGWVIRCQRTVQYFIYGFFWWGIVFPCGFLGVTTLMSWIVYGNVGNLNTALFSRMVVGFGFVGGFISLIINHKGLGGR